MLSFSTNDTNNTYCDQIRGVKANPWDDGIGRYFGIRRDASAGWGSRCIGEFVLELERAGVVCFRDSIHQYRLETVAKV